MSYIKRWLEDGCPADKEYYTHEEAWSEGSDMTMSVIWFTAMALFMVAFIGVLVYLFI